MMRENEMCPKFAGAQYHLGGGQGEHIPRWMNGTRRTKLRSPLTSLVKPVHYYLELTHGCHNALMTSHYCNMPVARWIASPSSLLSPFAAMACEMDPAAFCPEGFE